MFEWILVLTVWTGAGGGVATETVVFQTDRECEVAGGTWVTFSHQPNGVGIRGTTVRDYVCLKRTKPVTNDPQGTPSEPKR